MQTPQPILITPREAADVLIEFVAEYPCELMPMPAEGALTMRVVIYARYSSDHQRESSIEARFWLWLGACGA